MRTYPADRIGRPYGIRNEYAPTPNGRERLTAWEGSFYAVHVADILELPRRDGYMITTYNGDKIRVACPSPRTQENYNEVDAALTAALVANLGPAT